MREDAPTRPPETPDANALAVVASVMLAELTTADPGFVDRMIARLGSTMVRSAVVHLREARPSASVQAQHEALEWLCALAPVLAHVRRRPKGKRRR